TVAMPMIAPMPANTAWTGRRLATAPVRTPGEAAIGLAAELRGFLRAARGVPRAVRMRADAGQSATLHDQVLVADRAAFEVALQDFAHAGGVTRLRGKRSAGDVRRHAMVRHGAPRMVLGRGLGEPHVAAIAGQLSAL